MTFISKKINYSQLLKDQVILRTKSNAPMSKNANRNERDDLNFLPTVAE